jgi:hypothetical protein
VPAACSIVRSHRAVPHGAVGRCTLERGGAAARVNWRVMRHDVASPIRTCDAQPAVPERMMIHSIP